MTSTEWSALTADAASVRDALATVMWWARGISFGATDPQQLEEVRRVLRVVEGARSTANVVATQLSAVTRKLMQAETRREAKER